MTSTSTWFAGVIVDDPKTKVAGSPLGLDLGKKISLVNGVTIPTASDLAFRLVRTFFTITDPGNWKDYTKPSWQPVYPAVPVIAYDMNGAKVEVPNLNELLKADPVDLKNALGKPEKPGVGEIWVDTQFELTGGKSKPGTATAIEATGWTLTKKIALPRINMNHPHNMWTDRDQEVIYQTQWFDERLAVFDRKTGALMHELNAGPAPSHVMTKADDDKVHVAQNGGNNVREFNNLAGTGGMGPNQFIRDIPMGLGGEDVFTATHPHGHWMSSTGKEMVTPNENLNTSTIYNFPGGVIKATIDTGHVPIATGMMPDSTKYYVANFLDSTITVIDMKTNTVMKTINLIDDTAFPENGSNKYDPITGEIQNFVGALPIQTPVSPDGTNMVTANTLTATITIVDTKKDKVVAMLPCDPGCHGVQYGAKKDGGYYAYIANKFSNAMLIVDPDPDGDGDPSNAAIVGRVLLGTMGAATTDVPNPDTVIGNPGMGGQGVLAVPNVYNGWVQQWVKHCGTPECTAWVGQLTGKQKDPGEVK